MSGQENTVVEFKKPTPSVAKKVHVMVDLETLGLEANAIILSIGAVVFDVEQDLGDDFYVEINPTAYPGAVDIATIKWWMEQSAKGTPAPMNGILVLGEALQQFHNYLSDLCKGDFTRLVLWANGTDFDIPKLTYAYKACGAQVPWGYNNVRDCRTIFKLFSLYGLEIEKDGHHNAVADAKWQAKRLISVFANLLETIDLSDDLVEL
jgi:exodeoxyribonuclease VIII